jgi:hypothetical protein
LKANGGVKGPETVGGTKCKAGYEAVELPSANELEMLKHASYTASGVGGKPTIQFYGVNVQVVNGEGKTSSTNGEGNLVVGYDEKAGNQTGSHDLVLGTAQSFTSFGGIVAGYENDVSGEYASASGGYGNFAVGSYSSVSGGISNLTGSEYASISGGKLNDADGEAASISGGGKNEILEDGRGSISGGQNNRLLGHEFGSIQGGYTNTVEATFGSIFGGKELTAKKEYEALP